MAFPCRREPGKKFVPAFYPQGRERFIGEISERLTPMLNLLSPDALNNAIQLKLVVLEDGRIVPPAPGGAETKLASALKRGLHDLPNLVPATLDGKPVRQVMTITIYYKDGRYNFTYLL